ncbi:IclR family transcriptional regulator [Microbacterium soli]|uniref:DNA-binding transcriptional regulator KdgR n=1 Tax=Microbacterium soli TaxID=446075 RepID=A0ABP7MZH1_9MICO
METSTLTTAPEVRRPRTVQSVSHAVTLLRAIAQRRTPLTLSDLARKAQLSKPATYNLLGTLVSLQLIRRDDDGCYLPDWGLYELGCRMVDAEALRDAARAPLHRLLQQVPGALLLSIMTGDKVLYVDRAETSPGFRMVADIGRRSPLHTTASGKVFLAAMPEKRISGYLSRPLVSVTPATITSRRALRAEIALTREHGYGVSWGEQERLLSSVAVPLRGQRGTVRAALAVVVPTRDLERIAPSRLVLRLAHAATEICTEWDRTTLAPEFSGR